MRNVSRQKTLSRLGAPLFACPQCDTVIRPTHASAALVEESWVDAPYPDSTRPIEYHGPFCRLRCAEDWGTPRARAFVGARLTLYTAVYIDAKWLDRRNQLGSWCPDASVRRL